MKVRPYEGMNRRDCQNAVLAKEIKLKCADIPPGWSFESADFINKVIIIIEDSVCIGSQQIN